MDIVFGVVALIVGFLVGSFTLLQPLIIILFGLPTTIKLNKKGLLVENNNVIRTHVLGIVILLAVFIGVATIIYFVFADNFTLFIAGAFVAITMTIFKPSSLGANDNNIADYIDHNKQFFRGSIEDVIAAIQQK